MPLIRFPIERVVDINAQILKTEAGFKGIPDLGKLKGALSRIDTAIWYEGLDDVFEIAAKYTASIAVAHALSDANKRTALAVAIEFLSLSDFDLSGDNELLADGVRVPVIGELTEADLAGILYTQCAQDVSE
jgi:death on curing protein